MFGDRALVLEFLISLEETLVKVQILSTVGSLISLGAHFVWAFSLIFLFSGRGYWQELIESILWAHNKLKVIPSVQPRALSITQGRAVGVAHYLLGGIATTWSF